MAPVIPYTYIQCPCSDNSPPDQQTPQTPTSASAEHTFDPTDPRSNYSLYPLEYLLYCEDCQQIRCPRCVNEEVVTYYCPNCLFEVPSSNLRSEGNRCTRSCYQCPVCIGPTQVMALAPTEQPQPGADPSAHQNSRFALYCQYCNWTSTEIGIDFDRPSGIFTQLSKVNNGGQPRLTAREFKERRKDNPDEPPPADNDVDAELQYANLKSFYQAQLADTNASGVSSLNDNLGYGSPAALTRIMAMYTGHGHSRKRNGPSDVMREALSTEEGLKLADLDDSAQIKKLHQEGLDATATIEQNLLQADVQRFQDGLRPIPYLLRTKRSKRCSICRHIISKPENKVTSTRFKIKLVAKSYIPTITIRPLNPTAGPVPTTQRPQVQQELPLKPLTPHHYIITFKNPLFDGIKVTLATPNSTPGRFSSKVTILCPQFEVDANTDMWDDALKDDDRDKKRKGEESSGQPEAGKIWERGRNWVSIILEVVPTSLRLDDDKVKDKSPIKEDEDILEIPMFVRMEWEADSQQDVGAASVKEKEGQEKRELAYWCVLGVGRIGHD
ncbi:putative dynactin arp1 p62 subunit ro-2 [Fusarium sporotrichioides]|uniref:Dynactin subunit 4 n=1 Tax=Fusarium sporotrichioides TaxID=5514 RepID=A0A395SSM2_FUSSP|nr:putative dynactin arp1 p62 subunit ro-2 [Fusarium sporotrichioides]